MTTVAATIPTVTSAIAVTDRRAFKDRIQPIALKADADDGPTGQQGNKTHQNQDYGPVHTTSHTFRALGVAQEYGPPVAARTGVFA